MAAEDRQNYDPGISYAQRQILYRATGDRYWLENEHITKEQAGKQFALIRGKKKMENKPNMRPGIPGIDVPALMPEWDKLDPKDMVTVLREQRDSIICSSGLLWLRDWLKEAIKSEHKANQEYIDISSLMSQEKLETFKSVITDISRDESKHGDILEIIVDVITEKCGK